MKNSLDAHDPVMCHCLQVGEGEVVDCIAVTGAETVREIIARTGAGSGCTACHCRIRDLLNCRTAQGGAIVQGRAPLRVAAKR